MLQILCPQPNPPTQNPPQITTHTPHQSNRTFNVTPLLSRSYHVSAALLHHNSSTKPSLPSTAFLSTLFASSFKSLSRNLYEKRIDENVSYENLGKLGFKVATYEILVSNALTAMAGANAAAPSGPRLLLNRLSCAQERDRGGHVPSRGM